METEKQKDCQTRTTQAVPKPPTFNDWIKVVWEYNKNIYLTDEERVLYGKK